MLSRAAILAVALIVISVFSGCISDDSQGSEKETPEVLLWPSIDQARLGETVSFTGFGIGFDNSTLQFYWNFGDGATGTEAIANHKFLSPGVFNVSVEAHDANGTYARAYRNFVAYFYDEFQDEIFAGNKSYFYNVSESSKMVVFQVISSEETKLNGSSISFIGGLGKNVVPTGAKFVELADGRYAKKISVKSETGFPAGNWEFRINSSEAFSFTVKIAIYPTTYTAPPCCANG
ncbi:MAG: PKD domain-containing protein [Candidatus Thermoplasmatota archaeon]|nr:PKD domain-containing protein [Candidatus Thermoplasmatota archaeon]